LNNQPLINR